MNVALQNGPRIIRSIVDERTMKPPIIGKIRPGIKELTSTAKKNVKAVKLYEKMVKDGRSFDDIEQALLVDLKLTKSLKPVNTPYFSVRRDDFVNPAVADQLLEAYGSVEDDSGVKRLWRFPAVFLFDDWLMNFPNQLVVWTASEKRYFAEYVDNVRYCKQYAKPVMVGETVGEKRVLRIFGGRQTIRRNDDHIANGICEPNVCPEYQFGQCKMRGSLYFAIEGIKGAGLIELPTDSIYALMNAQAVFETAMLARGRLTGVQFRISKREQEIGYTSPEGVAKRQNTHLVALDCDIDIASRILKEADVQASIGQANRAAALLGSPVAAVPHHSAAGNAQLELATAQNRLHAALVKTGLSEDNFQEAFRVFAQATYGRGWTKDTARVNGVAAFLEAEANDRDKLITNVLTTARESLAGDLK